MIGPIDDVELWPGHTVSLTSSAVPHSSPHLIVSPAWVSSPTPVPFSPPTFGIWLLIVFLGPVGLSDLIFLSPDWCTGMMNHPPIPISELAEHTELLKANDNLKLSQEYEVLHIIPFLLGIWLLPISKENALT